jgi:tetratricopeptide (TPR) repeat protein
MTVENEAQFETLKSRLQQEPDSLLFARVADAMLNRDQLDEAIRICEEGIRKHPYYVTGHMVLGKCYLKKKLFDLAEKEFKRVILFDPKYIAAHKYYGDLMREVGWDNTCEMSYRKILSIDPLDRNAREMLETLERIKPKEQEIVTPEYSPVERKPVEAATAASFEESIAKTQTSTEPINLEDDLFAEIMGEQDAEPEKQLPPGEDDNEEVITTILEDIFEEDETSKGDRDIEHDTIDELNIKISPRQSSKSAPAEQPAQTQNAEGDDPLAAFNKFDEDTIEFGEMADIGSETNEHMKSAKDFEFDFMDETPENNASQGEENIFDSFEDGQDDLFKQMEEPEEGATAKFAYRDKVIEDNPQLAAEEPDFEVEQERSGEHQAAPVQKPEPAENSHSDQSSGFEREKIVTPTLGEIYAAQGQYGKAINVFEVLLKKDPSNSGYREKLTF